MRFCLGFLLLVALFSRIQDRFFPGALRVLFFDVGQGDSILLRFPGGSTWLIDAGGGTPTWDWGQPLVAELARMGILRLDAVLLTHPDRDHAQGLRGLLPEIPPREFFWNAIFDRKDFPILNQALTVATNQGARLTSIPEALTRQVEGVEVQLLALKAGLSTNENSLSTSLSFGGCKLLMAGDAEKHGEGQLVESRVGPVHVLKANHHGSRTSSSWNFLKHVRPHWTVISSGRKNRYGHPHPVVLRRLSQLSDRVLRTDFHGFIEFTIQSSGQISCVSAQGGCGTFTCALNPALLEGV